MAIVAGIDEAGFGPVLGPLVVSCTSVQLPDDLVEANLDLAPSPRGLHRQAHWPGGPHGHRRQQGGAPPGQRPRPLGPLERPVLVTLAAAGHAVTSWRGLLQLVAPETVPQLDAYPWYHEVDQPLPADLPDGDVATRANALRLASTEQGLTWRRPACQVLLAGRYNQLVAATRNKATVLSMTVLRLVDQLRRGAGDEPLFIHVDRLGGRTRYRDALQTAFPDCDLHILAEHDDRSAYRLEQAGRACTIDFARRGEEQHLAVALASLYSKYLRELCMGRFNAFWRSRRADLAPTAGYYQDAQRWLQDAEGLLAELRVDRRQLVRLR